MSNILILNFIYKIAILGIFHCLCKCVCEWPCVFALSCVNMLPLRKITAFWGYSVFITAIFRSKDKCVWIVFGESSLPS